MNDNIYDIIIDIKSFEDLKNNGWKIMASENGYEKYEYFKQNEKDDPRKKLNRVGILGGGNVGKTFILHKLINKEYTEKIKTKGISVIYPEIDSENRFVCLDTCNTLNTSLFYDKINDEEFINNLNELESLNNIKKMINDKNCINCFIEDFIIKNSNILIIVLNQLTIKEQKFLNRLKNNLNFETMFIIHNLQFFCEKKAIEDYIENVLKKSIFLNLEKEFIPQFYVEKIEKSYFFYEKRIGNVKNNNETKQNIFHLFMGKEGSEAEKFFNYQTIKYLRDMILCKINNCIFDVIEELKNSLSLYSNKYMINEDEQERPINIYHLLIKNEDDYNYMKCRKNFKLKNCIINEMGIVNISSKNSTTPPYICYEGKYINKKKNENWPALIIITEMFVNDIKISTSISDDYKKRIITISNSKKIEKVQILKKLKLLKMKI
jgi:GTPase SAR1 family protein